MIKFWSITLTILWYNNILLLSRDGFQNYDDFAISTDFEACRKDRWDVFLPICSWYITAGAPNCTVVIANHRN